MFYSVAVRTECATSLEGRQEMRKIPDGFMRNSTWTPHVLRVWLEAILPRPIQCTYSYYTERVREREVRSVEFTKTNVKWLPDMVKSARKHNNITKGAAMWDVWNNVLTC